jgi:hypothetical protein
MQVCAGDRMGEVQAAGVEQQAAGSSEDCGWGVEGVSQNGVTQGLKVDPELVGAAGEGVEFEAGGGERLSPTLPSPACGRGF